MERNAKGASLRRQAEIGDEIRFLGHQRDAAEAKERDRKERQAEVTRLGNLRLTENQLEELFTTYTKVQKMTEATLTDARNLEMAPAEPPDHEDAMEVYNYQTDPGAPFPPAAEWAKRLALNRDQMKNCALLPRNEAAGIWYWIYGVKKPYYGVAPPVIRAPEDLATGTYKNRTQSVFHNSCSEYEFCGT